MYCYVEATISGERVRCVLLATYRRDIEQVVQKKRFFSKRVIFQRKERSRCLIFVPHQHAIKEIIEIDESELLSPIPPRPSAFIQITSFVSRFLLDESGYCEYKIKDFNGYDFVAKDTSFIGNAIDGCRDVCLEVLYKYDKTLASLGSES